MSSCPEPVEDGKNSRLVKLLAFALCTLLLLLGGSCSELFN